MRKRLILIVALMGMALGIGWLVTAQEPRPLSTSPAENLTPLFISECPPDECP
jgi:hypothetical protein